MPFDLNPAAQVREVADRRLLVSHATCVWAEMCGQEKRTLLQAFDLGETLVKIRKKVRHGEFLPILEQIGLPPRRAQEYLRLAQMRGAAHLDECASIREALERLAAQKDEKQKPPGEASAPSLAHMEELVRAAVLYLDKFANHFGMNHGDGAGIRADEGYARFNRLLGEAIETVKKWHRLHEHQLRRAARAAPAEAGGREVDDVLG